MCHRLGGLIMPTNFSRRAALAGLLAAVLARLGRAAPDRVVPATKKELDALWTDLAGDEVTASRALLRLAARSKEAVELCRERLMESKTPSALRRHGGQNEEAYYNFRQGGSWWAEHRVERINVGLWGNRRKYWTRAVRAVVLLEHVGTPEAVAVLKELATGHA